jgi:prostaglandin-endoperoxide synthase 2
VRGIANRKAVNFFAMTTSPRPRPYSLWSAVPKPEKGQGPICDYTSWPSLTDKKWSGRHMPPAETKYTASLPPDAPYDAAAGKSGIVTALFERRGQMVEDRSSTLFMFFAQWFTDSVLRIDPADRRRNTSNHDIDLCQIYGLNAATTNLLRTHQGGRLRSQSIHGEEYLDYLCEPAGGGNSKIKEQYQGLEYAERFAPILETIPPERHGKLYATGLERGNSSVGYVAISTIFMREHNRLCGELQKRNPSWDDERLFQTARTINIVLLLKLVVEDYINHILGYELFQLDTSFAENQRWYRTNWIALEFDLLYRWHGLVPETLTIGPKTFDHSQFRSNNALLESAGLATLFDAASAQRAGRIGLGNTPSFLWDAEYQSLKMSRDFRLRSFNDYRENFGLGRLHSFDELTSDAALRSKLAELYGTIDRVEFLVGLFAEERQSGSLFGDLLTRMVAYDAFTQIFTNPLLARDIYDARTFTAYGIQVIEETTSIEALVNRNLPVGQRARASLGFAKAG